MSATADDYDEYFDDLNDDDLAQIDASIAQAVAQQAKPQRPTENPPVQEAGSSKPASETDSKVASSSTTSTIQEAATSAVGDRKRGKTPAWDTVVACGGSPKRTKTTPFKGSPTKVIHILQENGKGKETSEPPARPPTLLELFRPRGRISVSDLVTPSWCEYKFDYSLRGKRWKGEDMDEVIVSKHGKAIPVQKNIVVTSEKIMKQGQAIHKKLEDELPIVEVVVKVKSPEERFALQILNMIANLEMLASIGTCREFWVMGFVDGVYVTGIIDEITRKPVSSFEGGRKANSSRKGKGKAEQDTKQKKLDSFFPPSPTKTPSAVMESDEADDIVARRSKPPTPPTHYRLHLSDTKTRSHRSLPSENLSGRLQLMLYHQMLEHLITSGYEAPTYPHHTSTQLPNTVKITFSFTDLFKHLRLDKRKPFSDEFVDEAEKLFEGFAEYVPKASNNRDKPVNSLEDVAQRWYDAVKQLDLEPKPLDANDNSMTYASPIMGPVDPVLALVYVERPEKKTRSAKSKGKRKSTAKEPDLPGIEQALLALSEDEQMQLAIQQSMELTEDVRSASAVVPEATQFLDTSKSESDTSAEGADPGPTAVSTPTEEQGDVLPSLAAIRSSQESEKQWEAILGTGFINDEEMLALEVPDLETLRQVGSPPANMESNGEDAPPNDFSQSTNGDVHMRDGEGKTITEFIKDMTKLVRSVPNSPAASQDPASQSSQQSVQSVLELSTPKVIGVTRFELKKNLLDQHLTSAMEFWRCKRELRGVDIEDTWKCNTCEYIDGCEWREAKALEMTAKARETNSKRK